MAADYFDIILTRSSVPDYLTGLEQLRSSIDPTIGFFLDYPNVKFKKNSIWTTQQKSLATNILETCASISPQLTAQHEIDRWPIMMRAFALTLIDQINVLRTQLGLPTVTPQQALTAIRNKAATLS